MKKTAIAPSNIAFIKYWGKGDEKWRLPANSSFSMCLDGLFTTTTVEFDQKYQNDDIDFVEGKMMNQEKERIIKQLERIRKYANCDLKAKVRTKNNFPKSSGIASSASGMAALTAAACAALGLKPTDKELTILARQGSGSASRSIPSGFVVWHRGKTSEESFAESLRPSDYWDLKDVILIISADEKKISSTAGHAGAETSPFYKTRISDAEKNFKSCLEAFLKKDFFRFAEMVERDCISMHTVMMTQDPPLFYWTSKTMEIINKIRELKEEKGWKICFTIDAGPNVHVICEGEDAKEVEDYFKNDQEIEKIIVSSVGGGAKLINDHLF